MRRAVYAGSFDPITNGHIWMIQQGIALFDELIVAVGTNPGKKYTFSSEQRVGLLQASVQEFGPVRIDSFHSRFLVHYADEVHARYILRGIRNEGDYEYERVLRHINHDLTPNITTVFLMPPRQYAEVSSSLVKGFIGPDGWQQIVKQYVPDAVYKAFLDKYT